MADLKGAESYITHHLKIKKTLIIIKLYRSFFIIYKNVTI